MTSILLPKFYVKFPPSWPRWKTIDPLARWACVLIPLIGFAMAIPLSWWLIDKQDIQTLEQASSTTKPVK